MVLKVMMFSFMFVYRQSEPSTNSKLTTVWKELQRQKSQSRENFWVDRGHCFFPNRVKVSELEWKNQDHFTKASQATNNSSSE